MLKNTYVNTLKDEQVTEVKKQLIQAFCEIGINDTKEIESLINDALNSKLINLSDTINIYNLETIKLN